MGHLSLPQLLTVLYGKVKSVLQINIKLVNEHGMPWFKCVKPRHKLGSTKPKVIVSTSVYEVENLPVNYSYYH